MTVRSENRARVCACVHTHVNKRIEKTEEGVWTGSEVVVAVVQEAEESEPAVGTKLSTSQKSID